MNILSIAVLLLALNAAVYAHNPDEVAKQSESKVQVSEPRTVLVASDSELRGLMSETIYSIVSQRVLGLQTPGMFELFLLSFQDGVETIKSIGKMPLNDRTYSLNVPPASKLLYIAPDEANPSKSTIKAFLNTRNTWIHVSAVIRDKNIEMSYVEKQSKTAKSNSLTSNDTKK